MNPAIPTGELEVQASEIDILARSETPPFQVDEDSHVDESLRLKHRYLDLRRGTITPNLMLRHRVTQTIRRVLDEHGFLEVETPILTQPTPEGARDYPRARAACSPAASTPCRSRRSSTSSC